jgi:hypothetical protein
MGFGLVIRFTEHLQIVLTSNYSGIANSHTLRSLQQALCLLSLVYLHRLSPGNGFQRRSFLSFRVHVLTGRQMSHNSLNSRFCLLVTPLHGPTRNVITERFGAQFSCGIFAGESVETSLLISVARKRLVKAN